MEQIQLIETYYECLKSKFLTTISEKKTIINFNIRCQSAAKPNNGMVRKALVNNIEQSRSILSFV